MFNDAVGMGIRCTTSLILFCLVLCGQASDGTSVPDSWKNGNGILVAQYNFAMQCPWEKCEWLSKDVNSRGYKGTMFTIQGSDDSYTLLVLDMPHGKEDLSEPGEASKMAAEVRSSLPAGWRVSELLNFKPTDIPVPGAQTTRLTIEREEDHATYQAFLYVFEGSHHYMFMGTGLDKEEPVPFQQLLRSFRYIDPAKAVRQPQSNPGTAILLFLALLGTAFDFQYWRKGGAHSSKVQYVVLASAIVLCGALVAILIGLGRDPELMGELSVTFLAVVFAFWELSRLRIRRKFPLQPPASITVQPATALPTPLTPHCARCGIAFSDQAPFCRDCGTART